MNSPFKGSKDSGYNLTKDKYIFLKINFLSVCLKGKQIRGNTNQTDFITLNQVQFIIILNHYVYTCD